MAINMQEYKPTKHTGVKINEDCIRFFLDFRVDGKRYKGTWKANPAHSKADRLKTAFFELERRRDDVTRQNQSTVALDKTLNEYWEEHKILKRSKWSAPHLYKMDNFYKRYIHDSLGLMKVSDIKPRDITLFNSTIDHLSNRSQKTAYECMIPLFEQAEEDELIDNTPIKKKKHNPTRNSQQEKRVVKNAASQYKAIHAAIHKQFAENHHHLALFLFGFNGRRLTETTSLKWTDIDFEKDTYTVRAEINKSGVDMVFALPGEVRKALLTFRDTNDLIFNIKRVDKHYKKIRELSGVESFSFHYMRNVLASAYSDFGMDSDRIGEVLGHTDTHIIKQYLTMQRTEASKEGISTSQRLLS